MSIAHTENIFSGFVFAETLPNPTLVKLLHVKYRAVTYAVKVSGGFDLLTGWSILSPSSYNQPIHIIGEYLVIIYMYCKVCFKECVSFLISVLDLISHISVFQ